VAKRLERKQIFPEGELPDADALVAQGRKMAEQVAIGRSPFLEKYGVPCEAAYKRRAVADGRIMMHAQIGFRDPEKSRRAYAEIWQALDKAGYRVDRYIASTATASVLIGAWAIRARSERTCRAAPGSSWRRSRTGSR
jgi:hypothetical protein